MASFAAPELGDTQLTQNIRVNVLGCLEPGPGVIYPLCILEGRPHNIQLLDNVSAITASQPYSYSGFNALSSAVASEKVTDNITKISLKKTS